MEDTVSADEEDDKVNADNHPREHRPAVCHDAVVHDHVPVLSSQDLPDTRGQCTTTDQYPTTDQYTTDQYIRDQYTTTIQYTTTNHYITTDQYTTDQYTTTNQYTRE